MKWKQKVKHHIMTHIDSGSLSDFRSSVNVLNSADRLAPFCASFNFQNGRQWTHSVANRDVPSNPDPDVGLSGIFETGFFGVSGRREYSKVITCYIAQPGNYSC
jgi:hypothetical protein